MSSKVRIGAYSVGDDEPCFIIAEIGINHNGSLELAKRLIDGAVLAGCTAVKFQKRTPELSTPKAQQHLERDTPWGRISYLEYRQRIEFGVAEYGEIDRYCRERSLLWAASCWDEPSVDFIAKFDPPFYKIASACLTDDDLLRHVRRQGRPVILSTGMSTAEQIDHAVGVLGVEELILMHCTSTYPAKIEELNLACIRTLRERYGVPVGYSGHEVGLATTLAAVVLGACVVERHITLDRAMWGSDQAASVETHGMARLVRDIQAAKAAEGDGLKRLYESERPLIARLRRVIEG